MRERLGRKKYLYGIKKTKRIDDRYHKSTCDGEQSKIISF